MLPDEPACIIILETQIVEEVLDYVNPGTARLLRSLENKGILLKFVTQQERLCPNVTITHTNNRHNS